MIRNGNVLVKLIDRGSIQPTHRIIHTIDRTLLICDQRISKPHRNGINAQRGEKGLVNLVAHNSESKAAYIFNRVYGTGTIRNAAEADLPVTEALDANCLNVCSELLTYIAVKNGICFRCVGEHIRQIKNANRRYIVRQERCRRTSHIDIAHLDRLNEFSGTAKSAVRMNIDLPLAGSFLI